MQLSRNMHVFNTCKFQSFLYSHVPHNDISVNDELHGPIRL